MPQSDLRVAHAGLASRCADDAGHYGCLVASISAPRRPAPWRPWALPGCQYLRAAAPATLAIACVARAAAS
jgi:hypothetical protein